MGSNKEVSIMYSQDWAVFYKDIPTQQHSNFQEYFKRFLDTNSFDCIIELGTAFGGLTYYLTSIFSGPILTIEREIDKTDHRVKELVDLKHFDEHSDECIEYIVEHYIKKYKKILMLCDGGDRPQNVITYSKYLKEGDFIGAHDFFLDQKAYDSQKEWEWMQCNESLIKGAINDYKLERTDQYMLDIVWGMYKKTSKSVAGLSKYHYI